MIFTSSPDGMSSPMAHDQCSFDLRRGCGNARQACPYPIPWQYNNGGVIDARVWANQPRVSRFALQPAIYLPYPVAPQPVQCQQF